MRSISDVLNFREDLSPFLVHLTKDNEPLTARECLLAILAEREIRCGGMTSDAQWGVDQPTWNALTPEVKREFFGAVSLTETPLNEIHCLLDIAGRAVNLQPYGLVFLKEQLRSRGVSPALYLNNELGDKDPIVRALCEFRVGNAAVAREVLPLVAFFGQKLARPGFPWPLPGENDWLWEREWRYPHVRGPLQFGPNDVFVGLCPDNEIDAFVGAAGVAGLDISFVDPRRNMKYYAATLIAARQRLDIKMSVV